MKLNRGLPKMTIGNSDNDQSDMPLDLALALTLNALSVCESEGFLVAAAHLAAAADALEQLKSD